MVHLDERDLKEHLRSFRRRCGDAGVIAVHFEGRPPTDRVDVDGQTWQIRTAESEFALRSIVVEDHDGPVAVLTPLRNKTILDDLKGRLGGAQIFSFDVWQPIGSMFKASRVDTRLQRGEHSEAVARALMRIDDSRVTPVSGGFLDEDTAFKTIQQHLLGQQPPAQALADWLYWSASRGEQVHRLLDGFPDLVDALRGRLTDRFGAAADYFVDVLDGIDDSGTDRPGIEPLAVGLALNTAFRAKDNGHTEAATRLQMKLEELSTSWDGDEASLREFAEDAEDAWQQLLKSDDRQQRADDVRSRLDALLREMLTTSHYEAVASSSTVSIAGWNRRIRQIAAAIERLLAGDDDVEEVRDRLDELRDHSLADNQSEQLAAVETMAALAFRLAAGPAAPDELEEIGEHYLRDESFIDAAREKLTGSDPGGKLSSLLNEIIERALERSEANNRRFAELLADQLRDRTSPRRGIAMHEVLPDVVAPIAADQPVLLIVLDGLNWAVARWLLFDDALGKWERWAPGDDDGFHPLYATVPSATKFSRTSLLTGQLQSGQQHVERSEFAAALVDNDGIGDSGEAELLHKDALDADGRGNVGQPVREAILDSGRRVVGVVVNAIDDQLSGADQLDLDWSVDAVTPLRSLLELAGNRTVILVGDHGHVWETDTEYVSTTNASSSRWRPTSSSRVDGERTFHGPMVEQLVGEEEIFAAWSERIRYTRGSRGYHGGASIQEILTPLVVLTREDQQRDVPGCIPLNPHRARWWRLREPAETAEVTSRGGEDQSQLSLLSDDAGVDTAWIETLLESPAFRGRLDQYGQGIDADFVGRLIAQLHANNDKLDITELADLLGISPSRLTGRLAVVGRVLNRDGYMALRYDRLEQRAVLNPPLVKQQFEL